MALMLSLKRQRVRQLVTASLLTLFVYLCLAPPSFRAARPIVDAAYYRDKYPRLWEHVYLNGVKGERGGKGGRGGGGPGGGKLFLSLGCFIVLWRLFTFTLVSS
jgi:hypothetical protein